MRYGQVFGRRRTIFIGCTFVIIGAILQFASFGLPQFIVGRVVCGFGTGINTSTVPVWQSETTKPHQRGPVVAFGTSMVIAGVCLSYWIDYGFSFVKTSSVAWRFPVAFQIIFALIVLVMVLVMPESPRWLVHKDRVEEAAQVISALYDLPEQDPVVADQLQAIRAVHSVDAKGSLNNMFIQGSLKNRTRMILGVSIQILSQLTGINIITYYAAVIYQNEIGLSPGVSRLLAAGNGTQYFLASLFSIPFVKYFGRRKVLMTVSSGQAFAMVILAIMNSIGGRGPGIVAAAFLFVFNTFFGIGYAQVSWLYPAEITPLRIRAPANALSTSANWICNFMVVMITPVAFNNIGWRTYLIFAVFNSAALPIMYFCYPETKGRSLEEVDLIFRDSKNLRQAVKLSFTMEMHYDSKGDMIRSVTHDIEDLDRDPHRPKERASEVEHHEEIVKGE
ncbi:hypothetical protein H2204_009990 [Knufia peltigerae]|nr:hypothetical protein H2204_009990 [Knufia peltigerae]